MADLHIVDTNIPAGILGGEANHERIGKGPRLAAEIGYVFDLDANFFPDFPLHAILKTFAGLDKTGQHAVKTGAEILVMRQQYGLILYHSDNDGRRQAGIKHGAAGRAAFGPFLPPLFCLVAASAAVAGQAMPVNDLEGAAC